MDKYNYYEEVKSKLEDNDFEVDSYTEISYGVQFNVNYNNKEELVRIYESKKKGTRLDLSQVKDEEITDIINDIVLEKDKKMSKENSESGEIDFPKTLTLTKEKLRNEIKELLESMGAKVQKSSHEYSEVFYNIANIKITFFTSGKILFQGKTTKEADEVYFKIKNHIKQKHKKEFEKEIKDYFEEASDFCDYIEESETENHTLSTGEEYLGKGLFNYLNVNDQIDFLDAVSLYEFAKDKKVDFNNFAILIRNFAIVFEGFLIKIFIDTNIMNEKAYKADVRAAIGTKLADKEILEYIECSTHNKHIAVSLENVWQSHRNKNLHSDYMAPKDISKFERAENDIKEIIKVMKECYELLDFNKINSSIQNVDDSKDEVTIDNIDVDSALITLVKDGFSLKQQKKANWIAQKGNVNVVNVKDEFLKLISPKDEIKKYESMLKNEMDGKSEESIENTNKLIGVDESGKGDYFGPLVIAGVYVDDQVKEKLIKLGVDDSKKLSDTRIGLLAAKIKRECEYSIVPIGNNRYNKLYDSMNNLNKILAWGHARSIENILEGVDCNYALSDQFGNEELIKNALMEKGKNIILEQRPKAEENIAVAAASILARNEFISRLKGMSKRYNFDFNKGASNKVINQGKNFVEKYGKEKLDEVAKLHFKTTKKILS
ncbi:hypothetical protein JCM16358_08340 [Halanaerocella petrolearia]